VKQAPFATPSRSQVERAGRKAAAIPWARHLLTLIGDDIDLQAADFQRAAYDLGCPPGVRHFAWRWAWRSYQFRRDNSLRPWTPFHGYTATPAIFAERHYRSAYERRVAAALDGLGIAHRYESHTFDYFDAKGRKHWYTPDFHLPDLHMTFVEVKGLRGAGPLAKMKHALVLRRHAINLLLWDANIIDMLEGMTSPHQVVGLLGSTRIAA
jgi:hypothetical protein